MANKWRTENAAQIAVFLAPRRGGNAESPAHVALELQRLARYLHKRAEAMCNGDVGPCLFCDGNGCDRCNDTGYRGSSLEARRVERTRKMLEPFRVRVYEQTDPRGWPLYLIPEEAGPASEDSGTYNSRGVAVCPH